MCDVPDLKDALAKRLDEVDIQQTQYEIEEEGEGQDEQVAKTKLQRMNHKYCRGKGSRPLVKIQEPGRTLFLLS